MNATNNDTTYLNALVRSILSAFFLCPDFFQDTVLLRKISGLFYACCNRFWLPTSCQLVGKTKSGAGFSPVKDSTQAYIQNKERAMSTATTRDPKVKTQRMYRGDLGNFRLFF